jgi:hypothetical protein
MSILDLLFGTPKKSFGNVRGETRDNIRVDWENIKTLLKQKSPSQLRQALIVADKSLDNALRDLVVGESMGERLKNAKDIFQWDVYQKIWDAHKLRNNLVHESNFEPPYFMVTEAVTNIQRGLISLGLRV